MSKPPTVFSVALTSLIDRLYDGNRTAFSRDCGIPGPTLYTLCVPTVSPSKARLESLADALDKDERRRLLLAAAQDAVPAKYQGEVIENGRSLGRTQLTDDLARVVRFLEDEASTDPETAGMLRSIGRWAGILDEGVKVKAVEGYSPDGAISLHIEGEESDDDSASGGEAAS